MMHAANIVYEFNGEFYSLIDARIKLNMRICSKVQFDIYIDCKRPSAIHYFRYIHVFILH